MAGLSRGLCDAVYLENQSSFSLLKSAIENSDARSTLDAERLPELKLAANLYRR